MNDPSNKEAQMQMQIDSLKAEVSTLKEFVKALYSMIATDNGESFDDEYSGGFELGRYNT